MEWLVVCARTMLEMGTSSNCCENYYCNGIQPKKKKKKDLGVVLHKRTKILLESSIDYFHLAIGLRVVRAAHG